MKNTIYLTALILLISVTAAAPANNSQASPGLLGASSPLHQVEVAADNLAVSFGLSNASKVAEERLAEASQAANQGDMKAQERAMNQFNNIASKAQNLQSNTNIEGLLQQVKQQTPDNATQGLNKALENAGNITQRTPDMVPEQPRKAADQTVDELKEKGQQAGGLIN